MNATKEILTKLNEVIAQRNALYEALKLIVDNKTLPAALLIPARAALDKAQGIAP